MFILKLSEKRENALKGVCSITHINATSSSLVCGNFW